MAWSSWESPTASEPGRRPSTESRLLGRKAALARWAPQHEVVFLRFKTRTRYDVRHDLRGPLLVVLEELERLFAAHLKVTIAETAGFAEMEVPDLTWWAAREAVLNAVTHRDYFVRQSVQIELHSDRVAVASPGGFVGGVTPENVLRHPPVRRNPLLADVLQTIGLGTARARGSIGSSRNCSASGRPLPATRPSRTYSSPCPLGRTCRSPGSSLAR